MTVQDSCACELVENAVGLGVFCKHALAPDTVVSTMQFGPRRPHPWRHSIQLGVQEHAEPLPTYLRYLNHSCDPSLFVDVRAMNVVTLRALAAGDELTFFYPSTEWRMQAPFTCACGASGCVGVITGASELPSAVLQRYRVSPVIAELLNLRLGEQSLDGAVP